MREHLANGGELPVGKVAVVCRLGATVGELALVQRERDGYQILAVFDLGELGETVGSSVADQAAAALAAGVDAADIDTGQIVAVLCDAAATAMPALTAALMGTARLSVTPTHVGELAAAFGATRTSNVPAPMSRARRPSHPVLPRSRPSPLAAQAYDLARPKGLEPLTF